jgi:ATP-dependent 26S proteasome regulatory subunit
MNSVELENKYQSLIDRIELIKKKPLIISNTVNMLNQMKEFILKKRSTNTFTLDVYEQQSKNLDELESLVEGTAEELKKSLLDQ